jgi:hypothetical protein
MLIIIGYLKFVHQMKIVMHLHSFKHLSRSSPLTVCFDCSVCVFLYWGIIALQHEADMICFTD